MTEMKYQTVHGVPLNTPKQSPSHYQAEDGSQVISLTESMDFCSGNVVKYVFRAGKKEGETALDDLLKARWYLNRLIERSI